MNINNHHIQQAITCVQRGGIIAYPTEAVYGLGCDPFNEQAVLHLLSIKQRPLAKGLILIAATWEQVSPLVLLPEPLLLKRVQATWPGPVTWVFPASDLAPKWIMGSYDTIAVRVTAHPIAQALCVKFKQPLVSTSANIAKQVPAHNAGEVQQQLGSQLDYIVTGSVGDLLNPTEIRDAISGKILREG